MAMRMVETISTVEEESVIKYIGIELISRLVMQYRSQPNPRTLTYFVQFTIDILYISDQGVHSIRNVAPAYLWHSRSMYTPSQRESLH